MEVKQSVSDVFEWKGRKNPKKISRRDFFKQAGSATARVGAMAGLQFGAFYLLRSKDAMKKIIKLGEESFETMQGIHNKTISRENLEVKLFSEDLVRAASKLDPETTKELSSKLATCFYLGDFGGRLLSSGLSKKINRVIGGSAFTLGKGIDLYSTYAFGKVMQSPKFKEYGLDNYFMELNPIFSENPTKKELLVGGALMLGLGGFCVSYMPWMGRGYLGMSPKIANHNLKGRDCIMYAMKLGDKVKEMIESEKEIPEIREYLSTITPKSFLMEVSKS